MKVIREKTFLTLGSIWTAMDVTSHTEQVPFVVQTLGAISSISILIRPLKVCKNFGK
jgi:hypothetical protein